jgi:hypothetical protein
MDAARDGALAQEAQLEELRARAGAHAHPDAVQLLQKQLAEAPERGECLAGALAAAKEAQHAADGGVHGRDEAHWEGLCAGKAQADVRIAELEQRLQALQAEHSTALMQVQEDAAANAAALQQEHSEALKQAQYDATARIEDARAEAAEMLKKGTADLQQAVRSACAQLQVRP